MNRLNIESQLIGSPSPIDNVLVFVHLSPHRHGAYTTFSCKMSSLTFFEHENEKGGRLMKVYGHTKSTNGDPGIVHGRNDYRVMILLHVVASNGGWAIECYIEKRGR